MKGQKILCLEALVLGPGTDLVSGRGWRHLTAIYEMDSQTQSHNTSSSPYLPRKAVMASHHHHPHHEHSPSDLGPHGQLVKIFCKVDKTYNLAVRNDAPVMVPANSEDPTQLWVKDQSYGERTKDNYGSPAFVLINNATRKVLKHGKERGHQLHLVEYRPGMLDEDLLFTESHDFGEGFKTVRMASDTLLNMTLFHKEEKKSLFHHADKSAHQIKEGTPLVLDTWHENDHQLWKIFAL